MSKFLSLTLLPLFCLSLSACLNHTSDILASDPKDYRQEMRTFVEEVSYYAKGINPGFIIVPQNGHELLTKTGEAEASVSDSYVSAIDGIGREDLYYGYTEDNIATPEPDRKEMLLFMDLAETNGVQVLVTDYCSEREKIDDSYRKNAARGYISFTAHHRALDAIPDYPENPYNENTSDINTLSDAKNFLYVIDPSENKSAFTDKSAFLSQLRSTNYDILLIDVFYDGSPATKLSKRDVASLKEKANGGRRLVLCYLSIGEAEDYRYYWKNEWNMKSPSWLTEENPKWVGNYKVRYWEHDWKAIIYGNDQSYVKKILDAGFDGAYLDIIDAFEYFEDQ